MENTNENKTKVIFQLDSRSNTRKAHAIVSLAFHFMDDDKSTDTIDQCWDDKTVTVYVDFTIFDDQVRFRDLTEVLADMKLLAKPTQKNDED